MNTSIKRCDLFCNGASSFLFIVLCVLRFFLWPVFINLFIHWLIFMSQEMAVMFFLSVFIDFFWLVSCLMLWSVMFSNESPVVVYVCVLDVLCDVL